MKRAVGKLTRSDKGAVAPTVALSLFALIAAGGIAFDYAHMAALDTELQDAADQAALAAATQLDGATGARTRATAAANSLLRNTALFADRAEGPTGDPTRVTVPTVTFYQSYDEGADAPGDAATSDSNSRIVIVTVGARKASFALTPVVGVFDSGNISASAVASLASAICQVPPLMICAPTTDFPTATDIGKGVMLEPGPKTGAWVAGNYGYLDFGNGASGVKTNLGNNNDAAVCTDNTSGTATEPGNQASVTKALNSRFDLYAASVTACDSSTGNFCPAQNVRKDLAITEESTVNGSAPNASGVPPAGVVNPGCGAAGATVVGQDNNVDSHGFTQGNPPLGFPRDTCHIGGTCGKFGNGAWTRNTFMTTTHGMTSSALATALNKDEDKITRWDVYQWELADKANRLKPTTTNLTPTPVPYKQNGKSSNGKYTYTNRCGFPQPKTGTAVAASTTQKDRRLLTVAAVDCTGANGKFNAKVLRFVDLLLVEPSIDRSTPYATGKEQIYAEVVRVSTRPNGDAAFQYYLRQRPRLIK